MSINESDRLLKLNVVLKEYIPVAKSTFYDLVKKNDELKPTKIGKGSFWKLSSIQKYIDKLD